MDGARHKPGKLKQQNKTHKSGRHDTRSQVKRRVDGKMGAAAPRASIKDRSSNREDRKNQAKQVTQKKKDAVLQARRSVHPPKVIGVIGLSETADVDKIFNELSGKGENQRQVNDRHTTFSVPAWRQRLTVLRADINNINSVLDVSKTADVLLLILPVAGVDQNGEQTISVIKSQGMPTVMGVIQGLEEIPQKQRRDVKNNLVKFFENKFPGEPKILTMDNDQEVTQAVRFVSNAANRKVQWKDRRPYVLIDNLQFTPSTDDVTKGTLAVSGFLRGHDLNVNNLVHISDHGDFQILQVEVRPDPHQPNRKLDGMEEVEGVHKPDPAKIESLDRENVPDFLENEQTWPTDEEIKQAEESRRKLKKVPKGTSAYQAAWIVESDDEAAGDQDDAEVSDEENYNEEEMDTDQNTEKKEIEPADEVRSDHESESEEEMEQIDMNDAVPQPKRSDEDFDENELEELVNGEQRTKKFERSEEDLEFPDEVDVDADVAARVRFQKYRGLKSMRTSPWDPKENLPLEYAKIFQFGSFARTKKRVLLQEGDVKVGQYVTIHLANAPAAAAESFSKQTVIIASGLLQYENKTSVLNFNIYKHPSYVEPVQSKEPLVFHCGFRRYLTFPLFSENSMRSDKHKYEKFLQGGRNSSATIFGPITFPTVPLLVFKPDTNQLVATGSLTSVDPDRIILKRIILTGYPLKIHKKTAVIREMFYNPQDISWFKPVELWTKLGRTGHIKESLGTHGYMKCQFDEQLRANDTVCLTLYKREFPIWTNYLGNRPEAKPSEKTRIARLIAGYSAEVRKEDLAPLPLPKSIEKKIEAARIRAIQKKEKSKIKPGASRNGTKILDKMPIFDDGLDDDTFDYSAMNAMDEEDFDQFEDDMNALD